MVDHVHVRGAGARPAEAEAVGALGLIGPAIRGYPYAVSPFRAQGRITLSQSLSRLEIASAFSDDGRSARQLTGRRRAGRTTALGLHADHGPVRGPGVDNGEPRAVSARHVATADPYCDRVRRVRPLERRRQSAAQAERTAAGVREQHLVLRLGDAVGAGGGRERGAVVLKTERLVPELGVDERVEIPEQLAGIREARRWPGCCAARL